jgi:hypothetical protein
MQLLSYIPPVPYHRLPTLRSSPEVQIDTPPMAESAALIAAAEADLAMLARLAQIGMELAEAQGDYAKARLARATADAPAPLEPGEDPTAAFDKIAQTVRRTLALKGKVARDLERLRAGLAVQCAERRARRAADHERAMTDAVDDALTDAFTQMYGDGEAETDEGDALCREMLIDKEDLLGDLDEFRDWLDRPVGETIVRLCAAFGLPADTCVEKNGAWWVKRPPTVYQAFRETRGSPPDPASPSWGGTGREASRVGNALRANDVDGHPAHGPP